MKHIDIITKRYDQLLLVQIVILCVMGTVMLYSASSSLSLNETDGITDTLFIRSHLKRLLLGILGMFLFVLIDYRRFKSIAPYLMICSIFLLLVPFIGVEIKGSKRWLDFLFFPRFQPIEILKPFIVVFLATILCSEKNDKLYYKYFLSFLAILPIIYLLITQPDIGQTFLIFMTWLSLIFISGINLLIFFYFLV